MALRYYANGPVHSLSSAVADSSTTTIQVDSVAGWPTQFPFTIIIDKDGVLEEACDVTSILGTTLTVVRGVDSTLASPHAAGVSVVHGITARDIREANTHVNATTNIHGGTGTLLDTDTAQTITGSKNFTGGLQRGGSEVVDLGSAQTISGLKTFSTRPTTSTQGNIATEGGTNTFTGGNNFNGPGQINVNGTSAFTGAETHTGTETHGGTETHNGAVTFTAGVTTNALTSSAAVNAPGEIVMVTYTGTTDSNGFVTITHGFGFTPAAVWAATSNPSGSFAVFWGFDTITATTVRLRFMNGSVAGPLASLAVTGRLFGIRP